MTRITSIVAILMLCALTSAWAAGDNEESGTTGERVLPNMSGIRVVDQPVQMSALVALSDHHTVADPDQLPFMKYLQEETGVDWIFEAATGDAYTQKLNLLFAAGDLPEVVYSTAPQSFIIEQSIAENIVPLNDLIENYTVNLKRILQDRDDVRRVLTLPNGNIYSLFGIYEEEHFNWLDPYFVNRVWLERLDLEMPTSLDELRTVLIAFRDQDANGNGNPNDEVPLSWRETGWGGQRIDTFFGAFGIRDSKDDNHIGYEDGKVFVTATDPRYRRALEFLNGLYEERLLDAEAFTQNMSQLRAKTQNNQVGATIFFWPVNIFGNELVDSYSLIEPLEGPGDAPTAYLTRSIAGFNGYRYLITPDCAYPEVAIRYADVLIDRGEMSLNARFGRDGHYWESLPDDKWTLNESKVPEGIGEVQHRAAATLFNQIAFIDRDLFSRHVGDPSSLSVKRTEWWKQVEPYVRAPAQPDFWFSRTEAAEVDRIATDLKSYAEEMRARFVLEGVTDASWDEYVSNVDRIGAGRLIEVYQKAYDSYFAD